MVLTICMSITGDFPIVFTWYDSDRNLITPAFYNETSASVFISPTSDPGQYTCVATNRFGNDSDSISISMLTMIMCIVVLILISHRNQTIVFSGNNVSVSKPGKWFCYENSFNNCGQGHLTNPLELFVKSLTT